MPNVHTLVEAIDFTQHFAPASRTTSAYTAAIWTDMAGFEGGVFLVDVGAITDSGTLDAQVTQGSTSAGAGTKSATGAALTQITSTGASKQYGIEFRTEQLDLASSFRFVGITLTVGTNTIACGATLIRHRGRKLPLTTSLTEAVKMA